MRHVRMLGFCLIAMFVFAAVAASGASAEKLPAWGKCEVAEHHEGKYGDAGCTEKVGKVYGHPDGGYEWYPLQTLAPGVEATSLQYTNEAAFQEGIEQPVSQTTFTFASGQTITCAALEAGSDVLISGAHVTTQAPNLSFRNCVDEQGGECHTTDAENEAEITTATAWERGRKDEPGSWDGTMSFIEGKRSSEPKVGMVYQTEEKQGRFWQQLVCEPGEGSGEALSISLGGGRPHEQLIMGVTPVNAMSRSYEVTLRQSGGVELPATLEGHATKPIEAEVNGGNPETVGIETTMLFPDELYVSRENRRAEEVRNTLELKATP